LNEQAKIKKNIDKYNRKVSIDDIKEALYDANLDTEYREALAHSIRNLGYISDKPITLYCGTPEQQKELIEVETRPLDYNQISEIIHLMMYEMRNDFQYAKFRPVIQKYLGISEEMRKTNQNNNKNNKIEKKQKINYYDYGSMEELIIMASKKLKENNMYDASREMIERATESYSYADAFDIINEYVEIIKTKEKYEEKQDEGELE